MVDEPVGQAEEQDWLLGVDLNHLFTDGGSCAAHHLVLLDAHQQLVLAGELPDEVHIERLDEAHVGDGRVERLGRLLATEFQARRTSADLAFVNQGVTFNVYSDRRGVEKTFPFDLIPRLIPAREWYTLEAGLVQRIRALKEARDPIYRQAHLVIETERLAPSESADLIYRMVNMRG